MWEEGGRVLREYCWEKELEGYYRLEVGRGVVEAWRY